MLGAHLNRFKFEQFDSLALTKKYLDGSIPYETFIESSKFLKKLKTGPVKNISELKENVVQFISIISQHLNIKLTTKFDNEFLYIKDGKYTYKIKIDDLTDMASYYNEDDATSESKYFLDRQFYEYILKSIAQIEIDNYGVSKLSIYKPSFEADFLNRIDDYEMILNVFPELAFVNDTLCFLNTFLSKSEIENSISCFLPYNPYQRGYGLVFLNTHFVTSYYAKDVFITTKQKISFFNFTKNNKCGLKVPNYRREELENLYLNTLIINDTKLINMFSDNKILFNHFNIENYVNEDFNSVFPSINSFFGNKCSNWKVSVYGEKEKQIVISTPKGSFRCKKYRGVVKGTIEFLNIKNTKVCKIKDSDLEDEWFFVFDDDQIVCINSYFEKLVLEEYEENLN